MAMIRTYGIYHETHYTSEYCIVSLKTIAATAKLATFATAKFSIKQSGSRGLLLCLLFGVDLRSKELCRCKFYGALSKKCATTIAK